jgi:hypothetical protein
MRWLIAIAVVTRLSFAAPPGPSWWRHVAKPLAAQDDADPAIRAARDQHFDALIGAHERLDKPASGTPAGFVSDTMDVGPEIASADIVAVVTFDDYQPYLSASARSLYTEVRLGVERMVKAGTGGLARPSLILIYPGGTARTPSGVITYGSNLDQPFDLQPHHRYVVFLRHETAGDYYSLVQSWELRGDVVYPNTAGNVRRAKAGESLYSGMPEDAFIALLRALIGN